MQASPCLPGADDSAPGRRDELIYGRPNTCLGHYWCCQAADLAVSPGPVRMRMILIVDGLPRNASTAASSASLDDLHHRAPLTLYRGLPCLSVASFIYHASKTRWSYARRRPSNAAIGHFGRIAPALTPGSRDTGIKGRAGRSLWPSGG